MEDDTFYYTDYFKANSSVIDNVWYDELSRALRVELSSGVVCGYEQVTSSTFKEFSTASSHGKFWNSQIKGLHPGVSAHQEPYYVMRQPDMEDSGDLITQWENELVASNNNTDYIVVVEVTGRVNQPTRAKDAESAMQSVKDQFASFGLHVKVVSVNERD